MSDEILKKLEEIERRLANIEKQRPAPNYPPPVPPGTIGDMPYTPPYTWPGMPYYWSRFQIS